MRIVRFNLSFSMPTYDREIVEIRKDEGYIFTEKFITEIVSIYGSQIISENIDFENVSLLKKYDGSDLNGKKIFCFRTSGLGDLMAMCVPLRLIHDKYPDVKITIGSSPAYKDFILSYDFVDHFVSIPYPMKYFHESDYVFHFQGIVESSIESRSTNMYDLFISAFGFKFGEEINRNPTVFVSEQEREIVYNIFKENNVFSGNKKVVGVQLGTSSIIRNYPTHYYKELVSRLSSCGLSVVLLGDLSLNRIAMESGLANNKISYNFSPKSTSIQKYISSIDLCDFIISPDTSAIHIAGALNKPFIGIFGAIKSDLRIKNLNNAIGIDCKTLCSPCFKHGNKPCRNSDESGFSYCMYLAEPSVIVDAVKNKILPLLGDSTQITKTKAYEPCSNERRAIVTLTIGDKAKAEYAVARPSLEAYSKKVNAELVVINKEKIKIRGPKFEKFQIKDLLRIYDRIMYVDSDIVINPNCDDLFSIVPKNCVGAVPDSPDGKWNNLNRFEEISLSQSTLGEVGWTSGYFNSGVMVLSKQHVGLFDNPENRLEINSQFGDQTIINYNFFKNKYDFFVLDKKYNGMEINGFSSRSNPETKTNAMIMHFANEGNKKEQMEFILGKFNEFSKDLLFYDCGELGWSMYLSAHLNYLSKINPHKITLATYKSRFPLYNGLKINKIEIPDEITNKIKHLNRDGNHLFDESKNTRIKHDYISELFSNHFPDKVVVSEYGKFDNKRTFSKYIPSDNAIKESENISGNKRCILVFPRRRSGKFAQRNVPESFYVDLCNKLCDTYFNHTIISIGSSDESCFIDGKIKHDNFVDLTEWNDDETIDLLIALCFRGIVDLAVGSQSSLPKISLLCGVPTFMIGHQKHRHIISENWMNTKAGFYDLYNNKETYDSFNHKKCIEEIIDFGEIQIPIRVEKLDEYVLESGGDLYDEEFDSKEVMEYIHGTPIVFYDCGEIGWSQFISAYIRSFRDNDGENCWKKIIVSTTPAKKVFYHDCCDNIIDLPPKLMRLVEEKKYSPERNCFIDPNVENPYKNNAVINNHQIKKMMEEYIPGCEIFNDYEVIQKTYRKYFKPYISSKKARDKVEEICGDKKSILIFPRRRHGRFSDRNLSFKFYNKLVSRIASDFPDKLIIQLGSSKSSYNLTIAANSNSFIDLVNYNDDETLDILVAICNLDKSLFSVGSQSSLPKISLLCGLPSFMIGHQKQRHTIVENWMETHVGFYELNIKSNEPYDMSEDEIDFCINQIIMFGKEIENENNI